MERLQTNIDAPTSYKKLEKNYTDVYNNWKATPDAKTSGELLKAVSPIVRTAIRTYGGANPSPTLNSKAKQIILSSMPRYDPNKAQLNTFLMQQLQALQRARFKEQEIITIPEQIRLDYQHMTTAENELRDKLGRQPSTLELSDHVGLSPKRLTYIRKAHPGASESSLTRYQEDTEDVYMPPVESDDTKNWLEFIYYSVDPRDQLILEHSFGLHGKPVITNQELARKLGITPSAVSQRKAKLQNQIFMKEDLQVF